MAHVTVVLVDVILDIVEKFKLRIGIDFQNFSSSLNLSTFKFIRPNLNRDSWSKLWMVNDVFEPMADQHQILMEIFLWHLQENHFQEFIWKIGNLDFSGIRF